MLSKSNSSGTTQYGWDFENRMVSAAMPGTGGTVTFQYDPFGRRIQKLFTQGTTSTTTNYLYDGASDVMEVDQGGNMLARYTGGAGIDEPLAAFRSSTASFYEQDGLGSVTSLTGSTGAFLNTYVYRAFGDLAGSSGSAVNPFQYTGRDYDPETGLRYYRARYYDSSVGRFLRDDPRKEVVRGMNFYPYVLNNPTNHIDPSGKSPWDWWNKLLEWLHLGKETKEKADTGIDWTLCSIYYADCASQALHIKYDMAKAMSTDAQIYAQEVVDLAQQLGANSMSQLNLKLCMGGNEECKKALECSKLGLTNPLPFPLPTGQ